MRLSSIMLYTHFNDEDRSYKNDLDKQERLSRDNHIPYVALKIYKYSSFKYLYLSGDDQALVNAATGHNHSSFNKIFNKFKPTYDTYMCDIEKGLVLRKVLHINGTPKGRARDMTACGCLGLILVWFRTRSSFVRSLFMLFGQTSSLMYHLLKLDRNYYFIS